MGDLTKFFDDIWKKYVDIPVQRMDSSDISDQDLKNIEMALIRFADMSCKRAFL
ncbi:MAG: hypothetical protein K6F75_12135 [Butyrivibrio sp.]|nr:hypothetical protein [Butyrivibrio sp.]